MHVVSKENVTRVVLCMDIPYVCDTRHGGDGRMHRGIWMAVEEVLKLREKRSRGCSGRAPWLSRYCILFPPLLPPYTHSLLCSSPPPPLSLPLLPPPSSSSPSPSPLSRLFCPSPVRFSPQIYLFSPPRDETRGIPLAGQKAAVSRIAARRHPRRTPRGLCKLWTPSTSTAR